MNVLKPGYIPETWERGEPLEIMQAPRDGEGTVMQAPSLVTALLPMDTPLFQFFMIRFHSRDVAEVQAWLNWWYEKS